VAEQVKSPKSPLRRTFEYARRKLASSQSDAEDTTPTKNTSAHERSRSASDSRTTGRDGTVVAMRPYPPLTSLALETKSISTSSGEPFLVPILSPKELERKLAAEEAGREEETLVAVETKIRDVIAPDIRPLLYARSSDNTPLVVLTAPPHKSILKT